MAGRRMLHSTICESEKLSKVSYGAECLFYRMLSKTDDYGNFYGDPRIIRGQCMPIRDVSDSQIADWLEELATVTNGDDMTLIVTYEVQGKKFVHFNGFEQYQILRNDRGLSQKFPLPKGEVIANSCVYKYIWEAEVIYIGSTIDFERRKKEHLSGNSEFSQFLKKNDVTAEVVEERMTEPEALVLEGQLIQQFNPRFNRNMPAGIPRVNPGQDEVNPGQPKDKYKEKEEVGSMGKWENLRRVYRKVYRISPSKGMYNSFEKEFYTFCGKVGEEKVLKLFELWAEMHPTPNPQFRNYQLKLFFKDLPGLIEDEQVNAEEDAAKPAITFLTEEQADEQSKNRFADKLKQAEEEEQLAEKFRGVI